ncbi:MAG: HAMP domain-containing histidine kinase, partial [Phycisphaerae bacterium]|nr:HAMP domain-containing histidine kinase [Phycisphaerae bacterium]
PRPPRFQRCDINRLIERLLTVLKGEPAVQRVRITYEPSDKPNLYADEAQLEQLLMNLVLNAAQASADDGVVQVQATPSGDGLRLTIDDHGDGMDDETARLAFEPFYTTKARGTGLGLPICRKIAEAHGGTISIRSIPGEGTTVAVRLPRFARAMTGGQTPDEYSRLTR